MAKVKEILSFFSAERCSKALNFSKLSSLNGFSSEDKILILNILNLRQYYCFHYKISKLECQYII